MKQRFILTSICLLLILSPVFGSLAADTTPREFAPVQKGFVSRSETVLPYAPDRIMVKFKRSSIDKSNLSIGLQATRPLPDATTGLMSIDVIGKDAGVSKISRAYILMKNRAMAEQLGCDQWFRIDLEKAADIPALVARYAADPNVEYAKPDYRAFPAAVPSDPLYDDHWGHNNTSQMISYDWSTHTHTGPTVGTVGFDANAQAAWNAGYGDSNVIIAIIDSGVDIDHPDLNLVAGYDFGDNDSNPDDDSGAAGHGTACAGVAASMANNGIGTCGIAPGCRIMPCKIANNQGSMYFSAIDNAIIWAADNGADVLSMSLGAYADPGDLPSTDAALQYAWNAGCVILAATSNDNYNYMSYPANSPYVIAVGAASPCGGRKRSSSSSTECNPGVDPDPNGYTCDGERWWGSCYGSTSKDAADAVDVIAPTIVPTTDIGGSGGYASGDYDLWFNGTSCATPYAAGVCALIKSANPTWTPAQIRDQLRDTAIDIVNVESGSGWDRYSGYGMVDAAAAVGGGGPVAPVAEFTGSPLSGTEPLQVSFTDQSSGAPTNWSWSFGDGGSSTQQNPTYTYNNAGNYTVALTVTNSVGNDTETKTGYITVNACIAPVAGFTASATSGDAPLAVTFTDQSTNAASWSWNFGDGGTSTQQSPSHTYTSAGTYDVTLTVTNPCGTDYETKLGYINVTAPTVDYAALPYSAGFESGALDTYWATFLGVEGRILVTTANTPHSGNYHLVMDDNLNGGEYSQNEAWLRLDLAGKTDVNLDFWWKEFGDETHTQDGVFFSDDGGASFTKVLDLPGASYTNATWNEFNLDLDQLASSAGLNLTGTFVVKFQQYDNYGVTSDGFAFDDISVTENTPQPPVAAFTGSPTSGSVPLTVQFTDASTGATSWSWNFGDGGTSTAQNPSYEFTAVGTYTVTLTATNAVGSDDEVKTGYITVNEVGDGYAALPYSTGFEAGAVDEFWLTFEGGSEGRILVTTANTPHSGSYHLVMDDNLNGGAYSQNEAWLHLNLAGKTDVDLDFWWKEFGDETHTQDGVFFSDDGGASFTKVLDLPGASYTNATWNEFNLDLDALASSAGLNLNATFVVKFQQYDNYGVTTDGFAFDDISVTENAPQPPVADFVADPTSGVVPLTVQFTDASTGAASWSWNFGDGGTSTAQNPSHEYTALGTYTVTLTATNAVGSDVETKTDYINVTEGGSWVTITYDDFEGGFGSYTDGGGDCALYVSGTYAHQGNNAADIQDNSGVASSFYHTAGYDVSGYTTLEVEFWYIAISMDRLGEDFWVQFYDGSTWQTVGSFNVTVDFVNGTFYNDVVTISSASYNFPTNAKLRFMCDASGNRDDVYIDEIEWRGIAGAPTIASNSRRLGFEAAELPETPAQTALSQNYPNPFNPSTTIKFDLAEPTSVRLSIYDAAGRLVRSLVNETRPAGFHEAVWNGRTNNGLNAASGIYFYRIIAGDFVETKKMILLR